MKAYRTGLMAVGLVVMLAVGGGVSAGRAAPQAPASELDVEIAVDGTGSMASAIAQAKASGVGLTDGLVRVFGRDSGRPDRPSPWVNAFETGLRRPRRP